MASKNGVKPTFFNKWVAYSTNNHKVLAYANDVVDLDKKLKNLKIKKKEAIMSWIPPMDGWYAPHNV